MRSKNKKRGRPRKPYRASSGEYVNGLRRRKDGRWVIVETGTTYVEPDERLAIARFRRWQAEQVGKGVVELEVTIDSFQSPAGIREAFEAGASISGDFSGRQWVGLNTPEVLVWAWVRQQLINRPQYVADQVGIAEVARLADLPKPQPSPTLQEIGALHFEKSTTQRKQRRQVELFWGEFTKWMCVRSVTTLRQLTPGLVADYADETIAQANAKSPGTGGSPKYLKNRFTSIRGVINFARKRGKHPADVRHALDCCAVLQSPKRTETKDPHPIDREDFEKLLVQASDPRMRALLLVMLNLCMYPSEALALDWGEINMEKRTVVTDRNKTSIIRIGVLWSRTADSLAALRPAKPSKASPVFLSQQGRRWSVKTVNKQYRALRELAGVDASVKCEDCRDAAYTAAIESGSELLRVKLLAGHATGISDHYAKRRPKMVADAVTAIEAAYFGGKI